MLAVKEVADALKDHLRVRLTNGVETVLDELVEELGGVGHVEIAGNREGAAGRDVRADVRVAVGLAMRGVGRVAQVAEIKLAKERAGALEHRVGEVGAATVLVGEDIAHDDVEDALNGIVAVRADPSEILFAGRHVVLHDGDTRAVLAAIVLLLHEQVEPA